MRDGRPRGIPEQITQAEIEGLLILRQEAHEAHIAATKKQAELEAEEKRMMAALHAGTGMEPGPFMLVITTETTARSVPWRQVVEQHLGKAFAEQVLAATEPGKRLTLRVLRDVPVDGAAAARGR